MTISFHCEKQHKIIISLQLHFTGSLISKKIWYVFRTTCKIFIIIQAEERNVVSIQCKIQ